MIHHEDTKFFLRVFLVRNEHDITLAYYPLSLRDDCMDAGGKATHGAVAERVGVRGNNTHVISCMLPGYL